MSSPWGRAAFDLPSTHNTVLQTHIQPPQLKLAQEMVKFSSFSHLDLKQNNQISVASSLKILSIYSGRTLIRLSLSPTYR
jgi:hypothetical protein